jgi:hypothetical protein
MVCTEDIYGWFRDSASSQRIDLMCSLMQLCLPLELRFVGSCIEEQARRDYSRLREYDLKANDPSVYAALASEPAVTESTDSLHRTLSVYLSLLRSTNSACAIHLFKLLTLIWDRIRQRTNAPTAVNMLTASVESGFDCVPNTRLVLSSQTAADLTLLFTMASYHPAFSFSQRIKLYHMLTNIKQWLFSGSSFMMQVIICKIHYWFLDHVNNIG